MWKRKAPPTLELDLNKVNKMRLLFAVWVHLRRLSGIMEILFVRGKM